MNTRTLIVLKNRYNEYAEGAAYYRKTGDHHGFEIASNCQSEIRDIIRDVGYKFGKDYIERKVEKTVGGVNLTYFILDFAFNKEE